MTCDTFDPPGQFIVGLMRSGDLFLWHKDTDMLRFIAGMGDLTRTTDSGTPRSTGKHHSTTRTYCMDNIGYIIYIYKFYQIHLNFEHLCDNNIHMYIVFALLLSQRMVSFSPTLINCFTHCHYSLEE